MTRADAALTALLAIPLVAAVILAFIREYRLSAGVNIAAAFLGFLAALFLMFERSEPGNYLFIDDLSNVFIALTAFIGFTTSWFSASYIAHEVKRGYLTPLHIRFYHAMYQVLLFAMSLALVANNIGLMWVAIEIATLTTVSLVGIYRTHESLEAAWKYFILGGVGIALALFGTILVYVAAQPALGAGIPSMTWTTLALNAAKFSPGILELAFIFLLLGYGTKAGLAPLHAWLPDAHAEGPTPVSAILSGLLLNLALYALLRFKILLAATSSGLMASRLMIAFGLLSVVFAALMLYRRREIKRLFAYSSIEHMGIATFAFGIGGAAANFAGLLEMTMHSLTKSAIFFAAGHIAQAGGTRRLAEIRGLSVSHPLLAFAFALAVFAIAGLPPFGIFKAEFLLATSTFANNPWLTLILALGLLAAFGALILHLQNMLFGEPKASHPIAAASLIPLYLHLFIVLIAGFYLPQIMTRSFEAIAKVLG